MFGADGVAVLRGKDIICEGRHPDDKAIRALAKWVMPRAAETVFASSEISSVYPAGSTFADRAAGVLAITLTLDDPWIVLWFRAEEVEVIEWAGDPTAKHVGPAGALTPRASFQAWRETVHGKSRRWTLPEMEAAARLRSAVLDVRRNRQLAELNQRLLATLGEKDLLLRQKEFLIGEVNHRVQNSLQLVSSFLALQGRSSEDEALGRALDEARRRINAVALVHRRLYRGDQLEVVDAARYIEELTTEMIGALGPDWAEGLRLDLSPVMLPTDRAVTMGLILTELMINATKYAYGGRPGVLEVTLVEERSRFRLSLADHGVGKASAARKEGFGSRLIEALVTQLRGDIAYADNRPGLRVTLSAPMSL
jgi:two-component sensor histidine kinase